MYAFYPVEGCLLRRPAAADLDAQLQEDLERLRRRQQQQAGATNNSADAASGPAGMAAPSAFQQQQQQQQRGGGSGGGGAAESPLAGVKDAVDKARRGRGGGDHSSGSPPIKCSCSTCMGRSQARQRLLRASLGLPPLMTAVPGSLLATHFHMPPPPPPPRALLSFSPCTHSSPHPFTRPLPQLLIADFFFILFSLGWLGVGLAERSALQSTVRGVGEGGKGGGRRVWYAGKGVCVESSAAAECIAAQRSTAHSEESAPSGGAPLPRAFGGFVAGGVTITERGPSGSSSLPPPGGPRPPPPPPPLCCCCCCSACWTPGSPSGSGSSSRRLACSCSGR